MTMTMKYVFDRPVTVTPFTSQVRPSSGNKSSRWSKKATRMRAMKMKRLYETGKVGNSFDGSLYIIQFVHVDIHVT